MLKPEHDFFHFLHHLTWEGVKVLRKYPHETWAIPFDGSWEKFRDRIFPRWPHDIYFNAGQKVNRRWINKRFRSQSNECTVHSFDNWTLACCHTSHAAQLFLPTGTSHFFRTFSWKWRQIPNTAADPHPSQCSCGTAWPCPWLFHPMSPAVW